MAKKICAILFSRIVASAGMSLLAFVTTRLYGLGETGSVFFIFSIALAFSSFIKHGSDLSAISIVGAGWRSGDRKIVDSFVKKTISRISIFFIGIFILAAVLFFLVPLNDYADEIACALFLSYPIALLSFLGAALRAREKIFIGQIADIGGLSFLLSIFLVAIHYLSFDLQRWHWVSLSIIISSIFSLIIIKKFFSTAQYVVSEITVLPSINFHNLSTSMLQYSTGWVGILISGFLLTDQDMGVLNVCLRYSMVIFMLLNTVASVQAPKYAHYFSEGKRELIISDERRVRIFLSSMAFLMVVCVIFFSDFFLSIFNVDHKYDYILAILMIGQFMNVSFGCAMHALIASGFNREHFLIYLFSAFFVVLLVTTLGSLFQLTGIALAMACGAFFPAALGYYAFVKKI